MSSPSKVPFLLSARSHQEYLSGKKKKTIPARIRDVVKKSSHDNEYKRPGDLPRSIESYGVKLVLVIYLHGYIDKSNQSLLKHNLLRATDCLMKV